MENLPTPGPTPPCPPWCRARRHAPEAPYHYLDAGTFNARGFVLGVAVQQFGDAIPHVRLFTGESSYVDVSPEVAAVVGQIITGMDAETLRETGEAFTTAAAVLLGGREETADYYETTQVIAIPKSGLQAEADASTHHEETDR